MGRESLATSAVLDAGALIAFERGDRFTQSTVRAFRERGGTIVIPAAVLGQVWRDGARQTRLARLVEAGTTEIDILDEPTAKAVGVICGRSGTADVADASVVLRRGSIARSS
ncbi:MAG: hypothetical protein HYX53_11605 [Chloroflexi bacterium]|nr:hypothetical protein [Chloroflexota bacterium]